MKLRSGLVMRIFVTVLLLCMLSSSVVLATPQTLFAYTVTNANYSAGTAGAIKGELTGAPAAFTADINKITGLNGDPAFFNFFQGNESRLVLRQYTYSTTSLLPNKIIDPFAAAWTPSLVVPEPTWPNVANLHAVATKGNFMYATGYDLARIAVINMNTGYTQSITLPTYQFPTSWPAISLPAGAQGHGEGLVVVGNFLYALFTVNPNGGYEVYSDSYVIKFLINSSTGALTYVNNVRVGKNAFTLNLYNNKLYVCAVGGMQNAGSSNADTRLNIIDLANFTTTAVTKAAGMVGDFRDISIVDDNHAYVFLGNYDATFYNLAGGVYYTSVANLTSPALWTMVTNVNSPGYLWGIHADSNRLWFVRGKQVDIYTGSPTGLATPAKTFTAGQLGTFGDTACLNSAVIVAPNQTTATASSAQLQADAGVAKSFAAQAILGQQARKAAEELKTKK